MGGLSSSSGNVRAMRILFDGFWWLDGPESNRQVMRELIFSWERVFVDDDLIVAVPAADIESASAELPSRVRVVATRLPQHALSAILELPLIARKQGADCTVTHNFALLAGRSAVFVHDFMFLDHPEWFTSPERAYFSLMPVTLRRARWIFTSSKTEVERIRTFQRGPATVAAVGLGLSRVLEMAIPAMPDGLDDVSDFILAVGRINVRKNLTSVIEAALRSGVVSPSTPLLIVGEPSGRSADLGPSASAAIGERAVRFVGFIDAGALAWLYAHARVFVFLSLDEGFGMPTLEALHFGAPLVVSDIRVFREILGSRAIFVPPLDTEAVASGIRAAFEGGRVGAVDVKTLGYSWDGAATRMREIMVRG